MNTNSLRILINTVAQAAQEDAYKDANNDVASTAPIGIVEEPELLELYTQVYNETANSIRIKANVINLRSRKYDEATSTDFNKTYKPFNPASMLIAR